MWVRWGRRILYDGSRKITRISLVHLTFCCFCFPWLCARCSLWCHFLAELHLLFFMAVFASITCSPHRTETSLLVIWLFSHSGNVTLYIPVELCSTFRPLGNHSLVLIWCILYDGTIFNPFIILFNVDTRCEAPILFSISILLTRDVNAPTWWCFVFFFMRVGRSSMVGSSSQLRCRWCIPSSSL